MYCNNCGKYNPENSKFCKSCGSEIIIVTPERETTSHSQAEIRSPKTENNNISQNSVKLNAGLGGWLVLVGLGLIVGFFIRGYSVLGYLPLLSDTYNIPGYLTLLQLEFLGSIIFTIATAYLIYLYFKKNSKFPQYYIYFLISSVGYVVIDHLLLASLNAPTQELQQVITDTLSKNTSEVTKTIIVSILWASYIKKSKRVKATFINNK